METSKSKEIETSNLLISPCGYAVLTPNGNVHKFANTLDSALRKKARLEEKFPMRDQSDVQAVYSKQTVDRLFDEIRRLRKELKDAC